MDITDKRNKVYDYCGHTPCTECVLNKNGRCPDIATASESELDEALQLIYGTEALTREETPEQALDALILRILHSYEWIETRPEEFANTLKTLWELRK